MGAQNQAAVLNLDPRGRSIRGGCPAETTGHVCALAQFEFVQVFADRQGRARVPTSAAAPIPLYFLFLLTSRHPQPQVLLADGLGVWLLLVTRLAIPLTSFRSRLSPRRSLDQSGPRENRSLLG